MMERSDSRISQRLSLIASAASWFAVTVGFSGVAGWAWKVPILKNWSVGMATMKANSAAGFVLLGFSLWMVRSEQVAAKAIRKRIAIATAAAVSLIALLSLLENRLGWNLEHAGSMSQPTALAFLFLSAAIILLDWRVRGYWPTQFLCLGSAIFAAPGLLNAVVPAIPETGIALPTAVTFFVLSLGTLCARASWAVSGLLSGNSAGATFLRRAVPVALVMLCVLGGMLSAPLLNQARLTWVEVCTVALLCNVLVVGLIVWNARLLDRVDRQRQKAEESLHISREQVDWLLERAEDTGAENLLRRLVTLGIGLSILLTTVMSFLSWRSSHKAVEEADWVAHSYAFKTSIETTVRHTTDIESGARGFAMAGEASFLDSYRSSWEAIAPDLAELRRLTTDNPSQRRMVDRLEPQIYALCNAARNLVQTRLATGKVPGKRELEAGKPPTDAVRNLAGEMRAAESEQLEQRDREAQAARHWTRIATLASALVGTSLLLCAGGAIRREINASARGRAQLKALNASLGQRVGERTAALVESEERLAGVIQSAMDSIITIDEQHRVVLFNGAAERMFGYPAAEALGQPIERFIPQRFHAGHHEHIQRFAEAGVTSRAMGALGTLWAVRADREEFQIEASISQIQTAGKKLFTVILRDVTERKRAEEARERLAAVVESSDDAIISKTLDGIINTWNPGAEKLFGYTSVEAVGQPITMLLPPDRIAEESDILAHVRRGDKVVHFETVRVRKDGKKIDVSATISPIRDSKGSIIGASKIARDITAHKQAEFAMRASEERHRQLFERSASGMAVCEMLFDTAGQPCDYRFLAVNPAFEQMTGLRREQVTGHRVLAILPDLDHYWIEMFGRVVATGEPATFEQYERSLHRYYQGSAYQPQPGQFAASFTDVTERNRSEQKLAEKVAELARSNHDLEQFAYVASHDLQEPLRMVSSYAQLLGERYRGKLDENADKYIGYAVEGAQRMQTLIQDLLAFSRVGRDGSGRKATDSEAVVMQALQNLQAAIQESHAAVTHNQLPVVTADRTQLVQLFQNLIGNAIKFRGDAAPAISITAAKDARVWTFAVADNGIGIAPQHKDLIFVIFQRLHTRTEYAGNGIGLAICKKIVEQHGGRIWVESEAGRGSVFRFTMPARPEDQEETPV